MFVKADIVIEDFEEKGYLRVVYWDYVRLLVKVEVITDNESMLHGSVVNLLNGGVS